MMSRISGFHFYVNDDLNVVIEDCRGETIKHKVVSLNTFCKLLDKTAEVKDIETGILPDRCISYRESYNGSKYVTIEFGELYADITYDKYCKKGIAFLLAKLYISPKIEVVVRNTTTTICG